MKQRVMALVLSSIYCGLGQIYNRQLVKGLDFIIVYTLLIASYFSPIAWLRILGLSLLPLMWFVGMTDAYLGREILFERKKWLLGIVPGVLISILVSYTLYTHLPTDSKTRDSRYVQHNPESNNTAIFSVQVGQFIDSVQAQELHDKLLSEGYSVRVEESVSVNGKWFRVLVGRFPTVEDAAALLAKMREQEGYLDSAIYNDSRKETNP